jgi:AcrR family transcriptional regulator
MATPVRGMSTRALQAEQTRHQILETAQRLLTEVGYEATSLQMIADEMGLTKAAVYYHFRAKSDILHAIMLPGIRQVEALLDEAETIRGRRARIEHLVNGLVEFLIENRQWAVMASSDPAAAKHNRADHESVAMRKRVLALFYGEHPTGAQRVAYHAAVSIPESLPDLQDLTDDELSEALRTTMLRILRVPS